MLIYNNYTKTWNPFPLEEGSRFSVKVLPMPELVPRYNPTLKSDIPPRKNKKTRNKKNHVSKSHTYNFYF